MKHLVLIFLIATAFQIKLLSQSKIFSTEELAKMTVALIDESDTFRGTGVLIHDTANTSYFILTASHVAKFINQNSKILLQNDANEKPEIIELKVLFDNEKLNWIHHKVADIAICELKTSIKYLLNRFSRTSFPGNQIYIMKEAPPDNFDLLFFGFPISYADINSVSPLPFYANSMGSFISSFRTDTHTECTFLYLDKPSVEGCSGSPVFISFKHAGIGYYLDSTYLIGIVHGTTGDSTGGKLGMVTPIFYLDEL